MRPHKRNRHGSRRPPPDRTPPDGPPHDPHRPRRKDTHGGDRTAKKRSKLASPSTWIAAVAGAATALIFWAAATFLCHLAQASWNYLPNMEASFADHCQLPARILALVAGLAVGLVTAWLVPAFIPED